MATADDIDVMKLTRASSSPRLFDTSETTDRTESENRSQTSSRASSVKDSTSSFAVNQLQGDNSESDEGPSVQKETHLKNETNKPDSHPFVSTVIRRATGSRENSSGGSVPTTPISPRPNSATHCTSIELHQITATNLAQVVEQNNQSSSPSGENIELQLPQPVSTHEYANSAGFERTAEWVRRGHSIGSADLRSSWYRDIPRPPPAYYPRPSHLYRENNEDEPSGPPPFYDRVISGFIPVPRDYTDLTDLGDPLIVNTSGIRSRRILETIENDIIPNVYFGDADNQHEVEEFMRQYGQGERTRANWEAFQRRRAIMDEIDSARTRRRRWFLLIGVAAIPTMAILFIFIVVKIWGDKTSTEGTAPTRTMISDSTRTVGTTDAKDYLNYHHDTAYPSAKNAFESPSTRAILTRSKDLVPEWAL